MKLNTLRQARVGELLRETLAELLVRKVKDPRVSNVTLTGVEISMDLRVAHVFFCLRDVEQKNDALKGLKSAEGFFRHELKQLLDMKNIPILTFIYDDSFDYGAKIDIIFDKIEAQ